MSQQVSSLRELGYINETSLLRKDFIFLGNAGNLLQRDRLSLVSLTHQINDGKFPGYIDKEIVAGGWRQWQLTLGYEMYWRQC